MGRNAVPAIGKYIVHIKLVLVLDLLMSLGRSYTSCDHAPETTSIYASMYI